MGPMIGKRFKNPKTTGKKSLKPRVSITLFVIITVYPNRFKKPNISTANPMNGYLLNTKNIPPKKQIVPFIFSFRLKNVKVLLGPIIAVIPPRNNT